MTVTNQFFVFVALVCSINTANAVQLALGASLDRSFVDIKNKSDDETLAEMKSKAGFFPTLSLNFEPNYLFDDSHWGYQFQFDASLFEVDRQVIAGEAVKDLGTSMTGYSFSVVPSIFYHFKKANTQGWHFKSGLGVGVGYLNIKGDFRITNASHSEFDQVKDLNLAAPVASANAFIESIYKSHIITLQFFLPIARDGEYIVTQNHMGISYKYALDIF